MKNPEIQVKKLKDGTFGLKLKRGKWFFSRYSTVEKAEFVKQNIIRTWKPDSDPKVNFCWNEPGKLSTL